MQPICINALYGVPIGPIMPRWRCFLALALILVGWQVGFAVLGRHHHAPIGPNGAITAGAESHCGMCELVETGFGIGPAAPAHTVAVPPLPLQVRPNHLPPPPGSLSEPWKSPQRGPPASS